MHSFKRILKTVCVFLLLVCLLSVGFGLLYFQGECERYQDAREREAISGRVTLVGCGASYMYFGFRPDVFDAAYPGLSYNLSGLLLTMNGRYEMLRLELERNPIQTVLLEVSSDTLTRTRESDGEKGDLQVLGRLTGGERLHFFLDNFSLSEYPAVYYDVISRGIENACSLISGNYQTENTYLVRGYYSNVQPVADLTPYFEAQYHTMTLEDTIQDEDVEGLRKISALCREHGAELILMDVPKSELYNCRYSNHQFFHDWFAAFAAEEGITYYDFNLYNNKYTMMPDEDCFGDEGHMIDEGAKRFTAFLADFLLRRDRGEDVSQLFYPSYRYRDHVFGYPEEDAVDAPQPGS